MGPAVSDFQPTRFSASVFPEGERLAAWRDFFGPKIFGAEVEPLSDQPYRSDLTIRRLPGVNLLSAINSPVRFSRTRRMLADGCDDFGIHINSKDTVVVQRGREVACGPGEPILVTSAEPGVAIAPHNSRFLCLHISRFMLAPLVTSPDDCVLRRVPLQSEALRYLLGYVRFLGEADATTACPAVASKAANHLRDLVALLFGATGDAALAAEQGGFRSARLVAIKRFIGQNLGQPSLGVEEVALQHGVSARSVQRAFEREGVTFSEYILSQRLDRAYRLLSDPRKDHMLIIDIALECGFGDLSYFNRCFRRRFGAPPSWLRGSVPADSLESPFRSATAYSK